jgi:hypothetical protein
LDFGLGNDSPYYQQNSGSKLEHVLQELSYAVLAVFAESGCHNFFLLHHVTALRSLQLILPSVSLIEAESALRTFWRNVVTYYIAVGKPSLQSAAQSLIRSKQRNNSITSGQRSDWKALYARAIAASPNDVHLHKVTYVCRLNAQRYDDDDFFWSAAENFVKAWEAGEEFCVYSGGLPPVPPHSTINLRPQEAQNGATRRTLEGGERIPAPICFSNFL